ncbi:MAG: trehalose-phosphatase [Candidatus Nephthysia bennettiae]|uniref:Trehalose-phosphatase n=1 Tax=Candidatus Nephthysia bennettiae TaxID=3127016 RepID=A0A934KBE3_9BACT|nr:trehalose-phosphatase [Candidatus Dormibacteraeota bacterium]PZR91001.1 MAG: trehalose-phosphatase [Candidatus Dormibacteraeota bacterium]
MRWWRSTSTALSRHHAAPGGQPPNRWCPGRPARVGGRRRPRRHRDRPNRRSALEAGEFAHVPGLVIEGLYGAERWHNDEFNRLPVPTAFAHLQAELPDLIRRVTDDPDVWIEDKRISLVVHARMADNPAMILSKLYDPLVELASAVGMEVYGGKDVLEVRLPGVDKAGAIQRLITDTTSAVVLAGDDVGDIPAFSAVHAWRRQTGRPALTIGVVAHPKAPVAGIADLEVSDPTAVVRLLAQLLP